MLAYFLLTIGHDLDEATLMQQGDEPVIGQIGSGNQENHQVLIVRSFFCMFLYGIVAYRTEKAQKASYLG